MIQKHPYCRTCGSMVQSKTVCHYCGCEPLQGHNYCCDCGTSTIPEAIMCVHCGASFRGKFPATLAILISIALVVTLAGAGYFISESRTDPSEQNADPVINTRNNDSTNILKVSPVKDEAVKIINNIPSNLLKSSNDVVIRIAKNISRIPKPEIETNPKPVIPEKPREEVAVTPPDKTSNPSGRISMNVFSSGEMRRYNIGCTYFTGKSKNNVVFFTTNVYGYVKINGKVYTLQGIQKGNDIARFAGAGYEVTIEIEGLAGNENEWLADATLVVKDVKQRTLSRHQVYSSCTDF
ncbi:MAG TPA: hypothetical protein VMY77_09835 [Chitinophagaceae bacterium]|nr:hypothetical protein [Chitinophagaceae bacterium]